MVKAYIFDLNGVFLKGEYLTQRVHDKWGVDINEVLEVLNKSMEVVRQPNAVSLFSLWKDALNKWGIEITEEEFLTWWFSGEVLQKDVVKLCKELKEQGLKVFILSNNFRERTNYYRNNFPEIFEVVDKAYFSWETGFIKPSKEAFLNILNENKLNPEEVIYIDDSKKNLDVAQNLGITISPNIDELIIK